MRILYHRTTEARAALILLTGKFRSDSGHPDPTVEPFAGIWFTNNGIRVRGNEGALLRVELSLEKWRLNDYLVVEDQDIPHRAYYLPVKLANDRLIRVRLLSEEEEMSVPTHHGYVL